MAILMTEDAKKDTRTLFGDAAKFTIRDWARAEVRRFRERKQRTELADRAVRRVERAR